MGVRLSDRLALPLYCVLAFLRLGSCTCVADDWNNFNDLKWQEQTLKEQVPVYTSPETSEHILRMVRWAHGNNQASNAQKASQIYGLANVSKIASKDNRSSLPSPSCLQQILRVSADILSGQTYAQYGDYLWLGKYYECKGQTDITGEIVTKMCLSILTNEKNSTFGLLYLGTCFPEICTEADVTAWMELVFNYTSYASVICPKEKPYSGGDIASICIFSILAFFMLVGTVCETVFNILDKYYAGENLVHEARKRSLPAYLLLCFSLIKNTTALMNTERKKSTIAVLDGIRFLSLTWVILGHTLYFAISELIDNVLDVLNYTVSYMSAQVIINGTFAVDSFFFLSGLLVTYLTMRKMSQCGSLNIPVMYILRYLRLTPTLLLVMLFSSTLFMRLSEEPIYELRNSEVVENCKNYWWTNLLYVNNLYPKNFMIGCISWVWYLANDWQFFLLSPIFIYVLHKHPIHGFIAMGVVLAGSIVTTGALASHYDLYPDVIYSAATARNLLSILTPRPYNETLNSQTLVRNPDTRYDMLTDQTTALPSTSSDDSSDYFRDIYSRPWCRIGVYIIGMITGYILHTTDKKIKMHWAVVMSLWIAVFAIGLALIYGWWGAIETIAPGNFPSGDLAAFYEAVKRPVWALCLMWLTIACTIGYGGPINAILSWKMFMPLSRLTFCAYLVHPLVIYYMYTAREVEAHFRLNIYIYYFIAAVVLSYGAAYLLHILVEAPFSGLIKVIFYTPQGRKSWYAIFDMNVKTRTKLVASSNDNAFSTNEETDIKDGVDIAESPKQSLPTQKPYEGSNEASKKDFENPAYTVTETHLNETDIRTAL